LTKQISSCTGHCYKDVIVAQTKQQPSLAQVNGLVIADLQAICC